nr:N,N'-diacetylchitobiose phosphorylase [Kiritimatiellia bacterium]
ALDAIAWDGEWFIRAITESGEVFGSKHSPEGQIFLNSQSWAILSGAASEEQAECAMDQVEKRLESDYGLALHDSCFVNTDCDLMNAVLYLKGVKENGGIFQHTQSWAVMADCKLGKGARAYRHHRAYMPAAQNDRAEIRELEPYVYAQWTHTPESPKYGRSRLPWLSGTASWSYFSAIQSILGLRPEANGLRIDPCIPPEWTSFSMTRTFRGKRILISVENPEGIERGVCCLRLADGTEIEGSLLPLDQVREDVEVTVCMGRSSHVGAQLRK